MLVKVDLLKKGIPMFDVLKKLSSHELMFFVLIFGIENLQNLKFSKHRSSNRESRYQKTLAPTHKRILRRESFRLQRQRDLFIKHHDKQLECLKTAAKWQAQLACMTLS